MPSVPMCDISHTGSEWENKYNKGISLVKSNINTFASANECMSRNNNYQKQIINNQFRNNGGGSNWSRNTNDVITGLGIGGIDRNQEPGGYNIYSEYTQNQSQQQQQQQQYPNQVQQYQQQIKTYYNQDQDQEQEQEQEQELYYTKLGPKKSKVHKYKSKRKVDQEENDDNDDYEYDDYKSKIDKLYSIYQAKKNEIVPNYMGINQVYNPLMSGIKEHFGSGYGLGYVPNYSIDIKDKELVILYIVFLIFIILAIGQLSELLRIIYHII